MIHKILILFLLSPLLLFGAPLKIISTKLEGGVYKITFNNNIRISNFKKQIIKDGLFYDVKAELAMKRQDVKMGNNNYITIAQNSKSTTRIVLETKQTKNASFKINRNVVLISFKRDNKLNNVTSSNSSDIVSKPKPKNPIISLFESDSDELDFIPIKEINVDESKKSQIKEIGAPIIERIIVIDPGHGGKDCGAQVSSVCEKDIVLSIGNKLKNILQKRRYKVFTTRSSDNYLSLKDRTKLANDKNADLFISIHANSLDKKSKNYSKANGIETYFLSPSRSERARKVAELENKDDIEVMNYFSKLSFLNSINSQRMVASNKLAIDVQLGMLIHTRMLYSKVADGGVREGPFWVLAGALMPSILVEVGYMTNKDELSRLQNSKYQSKIASGIADGVDGYFAKNF